MSTQQPSGEPGVPTPAPAVDERYLAPEEENPHAGKGSAVVLDIGGDIGAVVLTCPDAILGREIEIVPEGSRGPGGRYEHAGDDHGHSHDHPDSHSHADEHGHGHGAAHPPHVGVVARPTGSGMVATAVFGEVVQGRYELALRPDTAATLVVDVVGGEVTSAVWPG